jgi:ferrous iron transport protein A
MVSLKEIFSKTDDKGSVTKETGRLSEGKKTLKELKVGETAQIVGFTKQSETVQKVEAMGLRPGKKIRIMQKLGRGILVKTSNSRIVITSDVAKNIEVK